LSVISEGSSTLDHSIKPIESKAKKLYRIGVQMFLELRGRFGTEIHSMNHQ